VTGEPFFVRYPKGTIPKVLHTFEDAINDLKNRYQVEKVIVVADRGMVSMDNSNIVIDNSYEFIVGERLRKLRKSVQEYLLDLKNMMGFWPYHQDNQDEISR